MKVLITGSTGFIGSSLLPMLKEAGHEVHEIVRYVSGGRFNYYERENRYFADLRDRDVVRNAVHDCKPEVIINLAAQTAVSFSFINPIDVQETNFVAVVALAEFAREVGVKQFIHASTSEVYGKATRSPIHENEPLGATSPYAVAKVAAEKYLWLMHEIYGFPITIMRPFNSYGRAPRGVQNRHYVVEKAICQALEERHIHLHSPGPMRDFLFRHDHGWAYVLAVGNQESIGQAMNVCTGKCWTILEMANEVARIVTALTPSRGKVDVSFDQKSDRPKDIDCLCGSNDIVRKILGWEPQYSLKAGLEKAIKEWMEALHVALG